MQWHYAVGTNTYGPTEETSIAGLIERGFLNQDTLVWNPSLPDWTPLSRTALASKLPVGSAPPPLTQTAFTPSTPPPLTQAPFPPQRAFAHATGPTPTHTTFTPSAASSFHRHVSFQESLPLFFRNYVNFGGRSSRGAYWWAEVWMLLLNLATLIFDAILFPDMVQSAGSGLFGIIASLAIAIPGLAIAVRRLHDTGKSGWWLLITFTIVGIIPLIIWMCRPGERAPNAYGPDVEAGR